MKNRTIKNFEELAISPLRRDALEILESGYRAIETKNVLYRALLLEGDDLRIKGKVLHLSDYERIYFVGIGKCAADAGEVFDEMLGERLAGGIVVDVRGVNLKYIRSEVGTHPLPSEANVAAAQSVKKLLDGTRENDLVIALISGGGSALLCLPNDLNCATLAGITEKLMQCGAAIDELNVVRKHLSLIQGGQFAQIAYPAHVVSLIFSDVPGNDIDIIASGPTVIDKTTKDDARKILEKYGIWERCEATNCALIETPKDEKYFEKVENILLLTNETALEAMAGVARQRGYDAHIATTTVVGEAREIGKMLAQRTERGKCILYGGETTVTVSGNGIGGRNQELALGALSKIGRDDIVVAAASDGWDNSPVAGALADFILKEKSVALNLDPNVFLRENNSYEFFKRVHAAIITGRTGSNVSDLYFSLSEK